VEGIEPKHQELAAPTTSSPSLVKRRPAQSPPAAHVRALPLASSVLVMEANWTPPTAHAILHSHA
jgi:hypothetical protein